MSSELPANNREDGIVLTDAQPPDNLPDEAKDLWRDVVPLVVRAGTLVPSDVPLLCEAVVTLHLARVYRDRQLKGFLDETVTEYDRSGNPYEVEYIDSQSARRHRSAYAQYVKQAIATLKELGLTPRARATMKVSAAQAAGSAGLLDALGLTQGAADDD